MNKLLLVFIILLAIFPTYAQDESNLTAIMLDGSNHNLIMVDSNGNQAIIDLPIPENTFLGSSMMSVSADTQYVAFCWGMSGATSNTYQLSVLEIATGSLVIEHDYGEVIMCDATAFNTDNTQVAVSTVTSMAGFEQTTEAEWALEVYDLATGNVVAELGARDEISATLTNFGDNVPVLADVTYFDGDTIILATIPYVGMGGIIDIPTFMWSMSDDTLTPVDYLGSLLGDSLFSADEFVFSALNSDYPAATPDGPLPQANEVRLFDGQEERVIYRNNDWVIVQTRFIANGQSIAILLLENAGGSMMPVQRIDILNRDGTIAELPQTYDNFAQIGNTADAGIILWSEMPADGSVPPISHLRMIQSDGTSDDFWTYRPEPSERGFTFLELVWSQPLVSSASYPAFPTVE